MAENIDGDNLFSSGGHVWLWGECPVTAKQLQTVAAVGAGRMVTSIGPWPVVIAGSDGGPAILKATGGTREAADLALDVLENAIRDMRDDGLSRSWEDDCGRTGDAMVIVNYQTMGPRVYGVSGATVVVWQFYRCELLELAGGLVA